MNYYLIEFFDGSSTPQYEEYSGKDAQDAVHGFRVDYPASHLQNVCLVLTDFEEQV
jgi:hypothetical protein